MSNSDAFPGLGDGLRPVLRLNMSGRGQTGAEESDRYQAALDMAAYADRSGFATVNVEEHHDVEMGWMPSPLVMAALIAARTERVGIRASAILAPLYDPIRLAEDVAMLDVASRGRFSFVLGLGYRESEYHLLDRDFERRGDATERLIATLLQAWTGEPFEYRGRIVHVSPRPYTSPHPPFWYGGMSAVAARRAARWGLPFLAAQPMPEVSAVYLAECARLGTVPLLEQFSDLELLFIDPDPDSAWAEIGPYFLREVDQYAAWTNPGVPRHYDQGGGSIEALRASGTYQILTPAQALERARQRLDAGRYHPILHPLAGGLPPARGWACLRLFAEEVLAKL